jgi:protein MpaA
VTWGIAASGVAAIAALAVVLDSGGAPHRAGPHVAAARSAAVPSQRTIRRTVRLGLSVRGRHIDAQEVQAAGARRIVLVVGCIHGNETAGIGVARRLVQRGPVAGTDLWVLPDLNPDGVAAGTRQNAAGVDLNRNFPWHWRPLGPRGTQQYSGPRALSEPESRIAHRLISRLRPAVTIWFHQPLGIVDESGGSIAVERRFAQVAGLPLRRLTRYPGSAASWQDARMPGTTAFVVELPRGRPSRAAATRYVRAVREVAQS